MIASQEMSFSRNRWCCAIGAKLKTCFVRIVLTATPTPENSDKSLIDQGDSPRKNKISV